MRKIHVIPHLRPSSIPGPRKEAALVRFALSNDDLKTSLMPRLSAQGRGKREGWRDLHPITIQTGSNHHPKYMPVTALI